MMSLIVSYKGVLYKRASDLTTTQKLPATSMRDLMAQEYLYTITEIDKRLRHFGWTMVPTSATSNKKGRSVVIMRIDAIHFDRTKHTYNSVGEALDALSKRLKDPKFDELVLHPYV